MDELAQSLRTYTEAESGKRGPRPVLIQVIDDSPRLSNGWVLCDLEGRVVRCLVPGSIAAAVDDVLLALPPSTPTEPYYVPGSWGSEANTYLPTTLGRLPVYTDNVSNPPTEAELVSAIGSHATVGKGFAAVVDDAGIDTNVYLVISSGTSWWIFTGTEAG